MNNLQRPGLFVANDETDECVAVRVGRVAKRSEGQRTERAEHGVTNEEM